MDFGEMIMQALFEAAIMGIRLFIGLMRGLISLMNRKDDEDD